MSPRSTDSSDIWVGLQIRQRRLGQRLSQPQLGERVGVTHAQIQKYEQARNRVSIGMLLKLCRELRCEPGDLLPPVTGTPSELPAKNPDLYVPGVERLAHGYAKLDARQRKAVRAIVTAMTGDPDEEPEGEEGS